jgi:hypothetical protein
MPALPGQCGHDPKKHHRPTAFTRRPSFPRGQFVKNVPTTFVAPPEGVQQGAPAYLIVKLWITCSALWRRGPLGFHSITNICGAQVGCIEWTEKRRKLAVARVEIEKQSGSGWCPHYLYPGSAAGMTQPWHYMGTHHFTVSAVLSDPKPCVINCCNCVQR